MDFQKNVNFLLQLVSKIKWRRGERAEAGEKCCKDAKLKTV
jgi:hypothetical protein